MCSLLAWFIATYWHISVSLWHLLTFFCQSRSLNLGKYSCLRSIIRTQNRAQTFSFRLQKQLKKFFKKYVHWMLGQRWRLKICNGSFFSVALICQAWHVAWVKWKSRNWDAWFIWKSFWWDNFTFAVVVFRIYCKRHRFSTHTRNQIDYVEKNTQTKIDYNEDKF